MAVRFAVELPFLIRQALVLLLQRVAAALVFVERDDPAQVGVRETVQLLPQAGPSLAEVLAPGLQLLGEPVATLSAGECRMDELGAADEVAEIGPDELIQLRRRDVA